ncbi:zinc metallo proteinase [Aspergillus piperis CBS 112811]|uniref:Zinc metallo proteinase n=1 Tax=Aspergillus piperis CBS 112811 TaxID=1448313 RepID=A0A8G1R6X9_9EURO|nr:zinc metallo proteinase [Aspergillus piperis CBS 112811]RAH61226.1 zinc metallo proteinase [Aspergillus piperis CBS 112811]
MTDSETPTGDTLTLQIHHRNASHPLTLPTTSTLTDLTELISSTLQIPPTHQKLLISPSPGMLKHPFQPTPLQDLLPLTSPKFKLTLLGTPPRDIESLNTHGTELKARAEARDRAHRLYAAKPTPSSTSSNVSKIHTLSNSANGSGSYTFHRCVPLSHLPNPSKSLTFLERLRDDPGIKSAMQKHKFSVPLLTEMDPAEHTTSESRTLGLNRNKGEVIELRLRTDAYDGYRDYRTIRKTLCHELAHCVFSEHDRDFWDLTSQIEKEVERGDWTKSGRTVGEQDFYNPGDWEGVREHGLVVDEKGWTGGQFVLGGGGGGGGGRGESRREVLAKAAEERMKRAREREGEGRS